MRTMKRINILVLIATLLTAFACDSDKETITPDEPTESNVLPKIERLSATLNNSEIKDTLALTVGESATINFSYQPKTIDVKSQTITLASTSLLTKEEKTQSYGMSCSLKATSPGTTSITYKVENWNTTEHNSSSFSAITRVINIKEKEKTYVPVESISIKVNNKTISDEISLRKGDSAIVTIDYYPTNADIIKIEKTVDDTNIATLDSNILSISNYGTTNLNAAVTYLDKNGNETAMTKSIKITVKNIISSKDKNVEAECVRRWDTDGDGYLSKDEALAVKNIGVWAEKDSQGYWKEITKYTSFDELAEFENLEEIPDNAFTECVGLTSFKLPNSIKRIGHEAFNCVCEDDFPDDNGVFRLPENLEFLGTRAFSTIDKNVKTIVFPKNVKLISNVGIITYYTENIIFEGETPPIAWNITGMDDGHGIGSGEATRRITIKVPKESLDKYNKKFYLKETDEYVDDLPSSDYYYTVNEDETQGDYCNYDYGNYVVKDKNGNIKLSCNQLQIYKIIITGYDENRFVVKTKDLIMYDDKATSLMGRNSFYDFVGY